MCGIAGVFDFNSPSAQANEQLVRLAVEKIKHRGPDEQGFFDSQNCSLGMCRLAIIDVIGSRQPSRDMAGRVVSVFNGEIYNFKELRELLTARGYSFTSKGDSELIPNLYREFGDDFPRYINGMFAIALWDEERRRGLLVRDRFGKKPLWYKIDEGRISFASELKGLIELNGGLEFDPRRLPEYLQFGYINAPRSIYRNVNQLIPSEGIVFEKGRKKEFRYWNFPKVIRENLEYEDVKLEAKSLITDAVKLRLTSDRPVGSFLSGGIDSSLVTALMTRELGSATHSFTIGFTNPKYDESSFARQVALHLGVNHQEKIVFPDISLILNEIVGVLDQPFADSSFIPTFLLAQFARKEVVVALGGDGGDEVFGGYTRYRIAKLLDKLNFLLLLSPTPLFKMLPLSNRKMEKLLKQLRFQDFRSRYLGFQSLIQGSEMSQFIKDEVDETILNLELLGLWDSIVSASQLQKLQIYDLNTYLPGDLMYKADMSTMAHGLELRSPFLDFRVVEFALSLPDEFKINSGGTKRILRDLLYELVPRDLVERQKMGFGIPRAEWLREELFEFANSLLTTNESFVGNWIQIKRVEKALRDHKLGYRRDDVIWPLLIFELWGQKWLS